MCVWFVFNDDKVSAQGLDVKRRINRLVDRRNAVHHGRRIPDTCDKMNNPYLNVLFYKQALYPGCSWKNPTLT
jgi:hypothetical protein